MANPDIPAALVVLAAHLTAAGAALTDDILDVDRGFVTGGRQIRYYWSGEADPPGIAESRDLTGLMVGQRFTIALCIPLSDLSVQQVTALDTEMQTCIGEIRTRILGDSQLGGNVTDLSLGYFEPDVVTISNARHVVLAAPLDLSYIEYPIAA